MELDPQTFDATLILTAAGIPVAAAIVASVIQILKRLPTVGPLAIGPFFANHARTANLVICGGLIAYAAAVVGGDLTLVSGGMLFLAWLNLVGFTDRAYEAAPDAVKTVLGGQG
jgi:hypothetical protein